MNCLILLRHVEEANMNAEGYSIKKWAEARRKGEMFEAEKRAEAKRRDIIAKTCKKTEFMDNKTGQCKNANDVYRYEKENQNITHDVNIDILVRKWTKRQIIDELAEFNLEGTAKELVNMVSRKKIDTLPQANKRTLFWANYWLNKYAIRGLR